MKRREFISLFGGAAAWPLAALAQQAAMPVIGFLDPSSPERSTDMVRAFLLGLGEEGYFEGRNVVIEYRWADDQNDRLPEFAADLVRRRVAVIMATTDRSALAAKAATATIPVVFTSGNDPVQFGLVASLNRPGGNLTGVTTLNVEVGMKRLQLLHEMVPAARDIAVLINPSDPSAQTLARDIAAAMRAASTTSTPPSSPCGSGKLAPWSSALTRSSTVVASSSRNWRPAMRCPRSISIVRSPPPAAS
jgi:putative ABC transport system substrate-binding protein